MTQVEDAADRFLRPACDPARPSLSQRSAVVLAHPDDETLGCGALLPRLGRLTLVHVTDGAPRLGGDVTRAGFASPAAYAAARRAELAEALRVAGVSPEAATCLGVADQAIIRELPAVIARLLPVLATSDIVLTHALERGHPDHDATALAVGAAVRLLGPDAAPAVIAMPFYRAGPEGDWIRQTFGPGLASSVLRLTAGERALKERTLAAHETQAETLAAFGAADEAFRAVAPNDLLRLPPEEALYDRYGWGVTSAEFDRLAEAALDGLGLEPGR